MMLTIRLRDGFREDEATISVDGREVWRGAGLTSDFALSLAANLAVPCEGREALVEIEVIGKVRGKSLVNVSETPFVDVRLSESGLEWIHSREGVPLV